MYLTNHIWGYRDPSVIRDMSVNPSAKPANRINQEGNYIQKLEFLSLIRPKTPDE
jgi:hypothetical protein